MRQLAIEATQGYVRTCAFAALCRSSGWLHTDVSKGSAAYVGLRVSDGGESSLFEHKLVQHDLAALL